MTTEAGFSDAASGGSRSAEADIDAMLAAHPEHASGPILDQAPVAICLDAGPAGCWTVRVSRGGRVHRRRGRCGAPDVTIRADSATIAAVLGGQQSGVGAFLDGRLQVRGSLGLSLLLDGILTDRAGRDGTLASGPRPARFPRAGSATVRGIRSPYLDAGPVDGPVVVALHGLGATNASMLPTVWELAADHRIIAPDLPGFGIADKPLAQYSAAWFARWLERFCDALGLDQLYVVGNSLGGRIAIEAGLRMPDRVRGLVLLTPSPAFRKLRQLIPLVRLLRPELAALPLPIRHATAVANLRRMFAVPERVQPSWYDAAADEFLRVMRERRGRIAFFSAMRQIYLEEAYGESGFWQRLPGLRPPALFIWGEQDRLVPHRFERHVVRALPQAESVVLPSCGHVPQFELPAQTHQLIRAFLARTASAEPPS